MPDIRVRGQIALLAARMMYAREESEYFTAKRKAAKRLGVEYRYHPGDLPSNAEIREQIGLLAQLYEGDKRQDNLKTMRLDALRMMRLLDAFHPRLIGSTLTGHVRQGSDIDLHVFTNYISAVTTVLDDQRLRYEVERKRVYKHHEERVFTHVHVDDRFRFELTVYDVDKVNYPFKSSITGRLIERASVSELELLIKSVYPGIDLDADQLDNQTDCYEVFRMLLNALDGVKQNPAHHPEGDALYHSLQVFELARSAQPWDEELLLAALLHDVGKGIDPADHVASGVAAVEDFVTERTLFLIRYHMDAHAYCDGTMGHRARQRLRESPDFDDLMLLRECDKAGRRRGVQVCTVGEALDFIRVINGK